MKRSLWLVAAGLSFVCALSGCGDKTQSASTSAPKSAVTLKVGATPVPHADILKFVKPMLKKEGIELEIVEFTDYVRPNMALADKEIDANYFQHIPYLEYFCSDRGLKLATLCSVHIEPMSIYSRKLKSLRFIADGAKVSIPSDPTNMGRALNVLADAGLIRLKENVGINGTDFDVVENRHKLVFIKLEAASLPRRLEDVDLAVINSNYALSVGLNPAKDALYSESKDSPFANVVVIRRGDNRNALGKLAKVLRTPEVRQFIKSTYKGAVFPTF